jgi:sec-independent protein translocase protein TatA
LDEALEGTGLTGSVASTGQAGKPSTGVVMFSLGVPELLVILVIVLLIFGAKRFPEIGRALGKSIREFKGATGKDREEIATWIKEDKEAPSPASEENRKDVQQEKMENIPGVKEAQEIRETASKIKAASKFFLRK